MDCIFASGVLFYPTLYFRCLVYGRDLVNFFLVKEREEKQIHSIIHVYVWFSAVFSLFFSVLQDMVVSPGSEAS